jgi:twitching motility protein PilJ
MTNSAQSPIKTPKLESKTKTPSRIQAFLQQRLVGTVAFSICLNLGLTGAATWTMWNANQNLKATVDEQVKLQELSSRLTLLEGRLSENTTLDPGKQLWEKRYYNNAFDIQAVTDALSQDTPSSVRDVLTQVLESAKQLTQMEAQSAQLVQQRQLPAASAIMIGKEYKQQKKILIQGAQTITGNIKEQINSKIQAQRLALDLSIYLAMASVGLFAVIGWVVVVAVRGYILDRENSQKSLQAVQTNLLQLNQQLQQEAELRAEQQDRIVEESQTLQTDIGHILDVVCALEEGNLTVQAEVNDRATGLVSDTLNRLVESLHRTIAVVVSSAHQVTDSAGNLKDLAIDTASQAQKQTQSIQQIQTLIDQVNDLTAQSREQALATNTAVELAQTAVGNGQEEMDAMVNGIDTLQQGTDRIVKRMQMLNDFVELTAQFSKEQKRVAALTRVLALNASLLSTRAIKEQDPDGFASIAREFETIANQVNNLASETNQSLISLQQRTLQIQTVTSGLNQDVSEIEQLVDKFTDEVGKSREAFVNIQTVTDRVAMMGERVNASSQEIVQLAQDTLTAIQSIGSIAENTETKATVTRDRVQSMGNLAQNLLQMMEFFRLQQITTDSPSTLFVPHEGESKVEEQPQEGQLAT